MKKAHFLLCGSSALRFIVERGFPLLANETLRIYGYLIVKQPSQEFLKMFLSVVDRSKEIGVAKDPFFKMLPKAANCKMFLLSLPSIIKKEISELSCY